MGRRKAYKIIEYIDSRIPKDISTQRDIYELKLEIEKVRAEVEKLRSEGHANIEKLRADLKVGSEKIRSDVLKWSFGFWVTQIILLLGILLKLLT
ncbi:MAG: hypothetical protein D6813_08015 [Calditrichaeota bacterium]|nr:MAG: hypothetical protein D6813_08015 [Calditrichota bacterium]